MKFCYHCMQMVDDSKKVCPACGKKIELKESYGRFLKPGTLLEDRYVIGESIGAGGFGITYIGWDEKLSRKVCIKEFYPEKFCGRTSDGVTVTVEGETFQAQYEKGLASFMQEAKNLASLQNIVGVVKVYAFFQANHTGYIVMEYLEGMDVHSILKHTGNKADYEWVRKIVLSVLYILKEVHKRGILHRDISPDNIFVTNDGIITLIDFGAAMPVEVLGTAAADIVLKEGYAPIEQYSRYANQGPAADLYAVSAMMYRMLTGIKPMAAIDRLQNDALKTPSELGVEIPEKAEMGMMVCLNMKAEHRLQSAEELMECLDGQDFTPVYETEWILPEIKENKTFLDRISRMSVKAKILLVVLIFFVTGALVFLGSRYVAESESKVAVLASGGKVLEDYTGENYDDVVAKLNEMGYENLSVKYLLSEEPKGTVLTQSVSAGERVKKTKEIVFEISGAEECYTMPDFSDSEEEDLIEYYTDYYYDVEVSEDPYELSERKEKGKSVLEGFKRKKDLITIKKEFSDDVEAGSLIRQSVEADALVNSDQKVVFSFSMGKEDDYIVKVPDFIGMTKDEINKKIKEIGLKDYLIVTFVDNAGYSDLFAAGQAMSQNVDKDTKINILKYKAKDKTKEITIQLSSGPQPKVEEKKTQKKEEINLDEFENERDEDFDDEDDWDDWDDWEEWEEDEGWEEEEDWEYEYDETVELEESETPMVDEPAPLDDAGDL